MKIIKPDDNTIYEAIRVLKRGGLIIYPTETMYGIGADATNPIAVAKLTKYKERPFGKPYSIAAADQQMAEKFATLNITARKLYQKFLPGPLTIISEGKHILAAGVESEDGKIGVRIPDYKLVLDIIKEFGKPITATSANASYKKRPYKIFDILENINRKQKGLIDLIIDAGELPRRDPSTVIDTTLDDSVVLRQGEIKFTENDKVVSRSEEGTQNIAKEIWQKYATLESKRAIIFALQGEMGVGKTQFTKGLAKAMGIEEMVTSPTYNLLHIYKSSVISHQLYHLDAWRLEKSEELNALGFGELIKDKSIISIEWAERVADVVREFDDEAVVIWVKISFGKTDNERVISWGNI